MGRKNIIKSYELAKEKYAAIGVNTDKAISKLSKIAISLHCWQGDDVGGFEKTGAELSGGGIQTTGNYPGKARSIDELRQDVSKAMEMIPGKHRLNLHACYLDNGGKFVERNKIRIEHFQSWIDWAGRKKIGLDFNPTFFSHPKADDGFTLSNSDAGIRKFWIEHGIACRKIAEQIGKQLGSTVVTNFWVPDGYKDIPVDRKAPRQRLADSLDKIFKYKINPKYNLDAVEGKLFGIGSESYVVGSHDFYMGYAATRGKLLCLDAGHFHPTEVISDKISSAMTFLDEILLHVSRPVRWDSDHVVILNDELQAISQELIRGDYLNRVHIGLDFFDASINRIAAWVIGTRSMLKSLLMAILEPIAVLKQTELDGDYANRLAMLEILKTMPLGAVWDYYCLKNGVPQETDWMGEVKTYEAKVLSKRS